MILNRIITEDCVSVSKKGAILGYIKPVAPLIFHTVRTLSITRLCTKAGTETPPAKRRRAELNEDSKIGQELEKALLQLRMEIASAEDSLPHQIFGTDTIADLIVKMPTNTSEMNEIAGLGILKLELYGRRILTRIQEFMTERGMSERICATPNSPIDGVEGCSSSEDYENLGDFWNDEIEN